MDWKYLLRSPTDFQNTCFQYVANYSSVFKLLTAFENRMKHVLSCLICYDNSLRQLILKAFCKPSYAVSTWIVRNKLEPWTSKTVSFWPTEYNITFVFVISYILYSFYILLAVFIGCSPSCGPYAVCQENVGVPVCVCNPGFQGDGYNCTGLCKKFSSFGIKQSKLLLNRQSQDLSINGADSSEKLPTYPSPKPTFCPKWEVSVNVGLGEGWVGSFPET